MVYRILTSLFIILFLGTSCQGIHVPNAHQEWVISASPSPAIQSPTLPFVASHTPTLLAGNFMTLTQTSTLIPSTTPDATIKPELQAEAIGCNTSLDISHGMGEVTNVLLIIKNTSHMDFSKVCATLSATDEERIHPKKSFCIEHLPSNYQMKLILTVDTAFREDTSIQVDFVVGNVELFSITQSNCSNISFPGRDDGIGEIIPIP